MTETHRFRLALFLAGAVHPAVILGVSFARPASAPAPTVRTLAVALETSAQRQSRGLAATPTRASPEAVPRPPAPAVETLPPARAASPPPEVPTLVTGSDPSQAAPPLERVATRPAAPPTPPPAPSATAAGAREKRLDPLTMTTLEHVYTEVWVERVERIAAMNFPAELTQGVTTGPTLEVAIGSDGQLRGMKLLRSSGDGRLDRAVMTIVDLAAPYAPFPRDLQQQYDVLHIPRTWVFEAPGR